MRLKRLFTPRAAVFYVLAGWIVLLCLFTYDAIACRLRVAEARRIEIETKAPYWWSKCDSWDEFCKHGEELQPEYRSCADRNGEAVIRFKLNTNREVLDQKVKAVIRKLEDDMIVPEFRIRVETVEEAIVARKELIDKMRAEIQQIKDANPQPGETDQ